MNAIKLVTAAAAVALCATSAPPAHAADTYVYICRVPKDGQSYPVIVNEGDHTLSWRGVVFHNLQQVEGCRVKWQATSGGLTAELCTATKGYADLSIGEASFDCELVRR
jgi:hypothetical protein